MPKALRDFVCEALAQIREILPEEAAGLLAQPERAGWSFVDVREPDEFAAGHVPGARNFPRGFLEVKADLEHPKRDAWLAERDRPLVLYCGGGHRSALAAQDAPGDGLHAGRLARRGLDGLDEAGLSGRALTPRPGRRRDGRRPRGASRPARSGRKRGGTALLEIRYSRGRAAHPALRARSRLEVRTTVHRHEAARTAHRIPGLRARAGCDRLAPGSRGSRSSDSCEHERSRQPVGGCQHPSAAHRSASRRRDARGWGVAPARQRRRRQRPRRLSHRRRRLSAGRQG